MRMAPACKAPPQLYKESLPQMSSKHNYKMVNCQKSLSVVEISQRSSPCMFSLSQSFDPQIVVATIDQKTPQFFQSGSSNLSSWEQPQLCRPSSKDLNEIEKCPCLQRRQLIPPPLKIYSHQPTTTSIKNLVSLAWIFWCFPDRIRVASSQVAR